MLVPRFWKALDELTGAATDLRKWRHLLGEEFGHVEPLLRSSGALATSLSCPSPGGDGCPRKIIDHGDGRFRAICGDNPKACDDLELKKTDIAVWMLDRVRLAGAVARALALTNMPAKFDRRQVFRLGTHEVFAGRGFPVFLTIPGPRASEDPSHYDELITHLGPKVLLVPTVSSVPASVSTVINRADVTQLALHDFFVIDDGKLQLATSPEMLFSDLRAQIETEGEKGTGNVVWQLPPDASWEKLTIRFISAAWINVTYDRVTKPLEPETFGLKNTKKQEYTTKEAWKFLLKLAAANGRLPVHQNTVKETSKHQKQKQALSKTLRQAFGIPGEPIPAKSNEYVARFVISADDLRQGRPDQRKRNFAELD